MSKEPLLQITLDDIDGVPKIIYKGEEIKSIVHLGLEYKTNDDLGVISTYVSIEHVDGDYNDVVIERNARKTITTVVDHSGKVHHRSIK